MTSTFTWWVLAAGGALMLAALFDPFSRRRRLRNADAAFVPGKLLASQLLNRISIWYVDEDGKSQKTMMIVHRIYGKDSLTPRYVEGFCYRDEACHLLKVEQILVIQNLESGESFADPARALAAMIWQARRRPARDNADRSDASKSA